MLIETVPSRTCSDSNNKVRLGKNYQQHLSFVRRKISSFVTVECGCLRDQNEIYFVHPGQTEAKNIKLNMLLMKQLLKRMYKSKDQIDN